MMETKTCIAFEGVHRIAAGTLADVAKRVKRLMDAGSRQTVLIFDDVTGELVEIDFRGTSKDVLQRLETEAAKAAAGEEGQLRGPGRPKLGVVSREVSLLPRHWDWLNAQPGGASVALRKLVEEARHLYRGRDKIRRSQEVAYRFMSAMAGNMPGFEEATRSLFAGNAERFDEFTNEWPQDVREYAHKLSAAAFQR
jgi:uncharacterized protein